MKNIASKAMMATALTLFVFNATNVYAQSANPSHGKTAAIPTKAPDGTWDSLSPTQQKTLAPLESDWDYMLPDSRKKWIYVANLYPKMAPADQDRLQSRMASWSNLSQRDRRIARENYLTSLKFPAEKKAEAWSAYQKLSDEQKKKLAEMETKKKPNAISAPTLQQHAIQRETTPPPAAPSPRAVQASTPESGPSTTPAAPSTTDNQ
ncbi:DUF3106 domain-containing protein [Polynucleobacter sp. MWH-UH25E]|uniref:DUF3106 domain-containing protein n=1 Tax=Polynucleobacter sp. MWH-UH25E TaxID=1855616 RepID=UPI001BFD33FB|nr:DUF3106 domain-containing protein [Polynucleobacter sp. MWH-UH25E]QWD61759.1 DUF3106 domain-containing protein [Polynucleobacter sp. MWH-UH25E]